MITTRNHGRTKADPLHAQNIGRPARMAETGEIDRGIVDLDTDQRAAFGQAHRLD